MISRFLVSLCSIAVILAPRAGAEIVYLKDGSRMIGEIPSSPSGMRLVTLDGPVDLDPLRIDRVIAPTYLELSADERTESIAENDAAKWHLAARMIVQRGLYSRALEYADRALRAAAAAGEELELHADLLDLPVGATYRNDALTPGVLATLLDASARSDSPARSMIARRRLETKLAAFGETIPPPLVSALGESLASEDPRLRVAALRAIAICVPADLAPRVGDRLVADEDAAVRASALDAALAFGENQHILVRVLNQLDGDAKARAAALDVLERMSDRHAVAALVRTLAGSGSGYSGFKASMSVTNQVSYVSDFDVEVAQNAVIADPVVGVAQEGATLEVTVLGVSERGISKVERERIGRLLERLTGARHGADAKAWRDWLGARR